MADGIEHYGFKAGDKVASRRTSPANYKVKSGVVTGVFSDTYGTVQVAWPWGREFWYPHQLMLVRAHR